MKSYQQFCGVSKALDLLGERWTLLIVRELLLGGRRYSDILSAMPGLTTNLLATRLTMLQEQKLIEKRNTLGVTLYWLTEAGRSIEPIVLALGAFGQKYMTDPHGHQTHPRWAVLSLKRRYRGSLNMRINLEVDDQPFYVEATEDGLAINDGHGKHPDLSLMTTLPCLGALLTGRQSVQSQLDDGTLKIVGRRRDAKSFAKSIGGRAD